MNQPEPQTCDHCGDIAPLSLWRKWLSYGGLTPGWHYIYLCEDCDNGPDMVGFEFVENDPNDLHTD